MLVGYLCTEVEAKKRITVITAEAFASEGRAQTERMRMSGCPQSKFWKYSRQRATKSGNKVFKNNEQTSTLKTKNQCASSHGPEIMVDSSIPFLVRELHTSPSKSSGSPTGPGHATEHRPSESQTHVDDLYTSTRVIPELRRQQILGCKQAPHGRPNSTQQTSFSQAAICPGPKRNIEGSSGIFVRFHALIKSDTLSCFHSRCPRMSLVAA